MLNNQEGNRLVQLSSKMGLRNVAVLLAFAFSGSYTPVWAGVIYSNFGPGDSYNRGGGLLIGHPSFRIDVGHGFIPTSTFTLDQVEAGIGLQSGTNQIELWLMSDIGFEPDSVLESFSLTMPPDGTMSPIIGVSVLHPELQAGLTYWLIASAPVADTAAAWNPNNQGALGKQAYREFGGPWSIADNAYLSVFRIQGTPVQDTPVPEASTFLLLASGLLLGKGIRFLASVPSYFTFQSGGTKMSCIRPW